MNQAHARHDDAWYRACVAQLELLEHHVAHGGTLATAFEPWCALCAAAAAALARIGEPHGRSGRRDALG